MDILVEPSMENARGIVKALNSFGFGKLDLKEDDFTCPDRVIQLGYEPIRVDILTSISGVEFEEVWEKRKKASYGEVEVFFIGKNELIKTKRTSNREQDKLDVEIINKTIG